MNSYQEEMTQISPAGMLSKATLSKSAKLPKLSDVLGTGAGCWGTA